MQKNVHRVGQIGEIGLEEWLVCLRFFFNIIIILGFFTFNIFIWLATFVYIDGDLRGRAKKSSHIGGFAKWMWKG
jgi:hypothetical protein